VADHAEVLGGAAERHRRRRLSDHNDRTTHRPAARSWFSGDGSLRCAGSVRGGSGLSSAVGQAFGASAIGVMTNAARVCLVRASGAAPRAERAWPRARASGDDGCAVIRERQSRWCGPDHWGIRVDRLHRPCARVAPRPPAPVAHGPRALMRAQRELVQQSNNSARGSLSSPGHCRPGWSRKMRRLGANDHRHP